MKRAYIKIFCLVLFCFMALSLSAQDAEDQGQPDSAEERVRERNINFDGRMLAGLNGDSSYSVSMTQGLQNFAYQLNSDMVYGNDFDDYSNSGFFTNETGFTGELALSDLWKIIPEFEIANSSYGMFDNPYYSEEKKDKIRLRIKNEYKPAPARWNFDLNFGRYDHRLKDTGTLDEVKETFYSTNGVLAMEYVWSASNKVGFLLQGGSYRYPDEYDEDAYSLGEFYGSFKITEFIMLTIAPSLAWNRDKTDYLYFRGNVSTVGLKYLSLEFFHDYKLVPYKPDEYMFARKYSDLPYDLPPATVNHSELRGEFEFRPGGDGTSILKMLSFRVSGFFENNDNLYNYYSLPENVLTAQAVSAKTLGSKAEFVTKMDIMGHIFEIDLAYKYYRYFLSDEDSDLNITYRPDHVFNAGLSYSGPVIGIDWNNSLNSGVYTDPESDLKLDEVILGSLDINIRVYDTFYIYSRIDNLYDREYSLMDGYPEPGVHYFAGLRVII